MVVIFYGTSAELIKLIGVMGLVPRADQLLICTAQQKEQIEQFHSQMNIKPDFYLAKGWRGRDVLNVFEMAGFIVKVHLNFIRSYLPIRRAIKASCKKRGTRALAIVHGDTLTTVFGATFGILLGLKVAHVEAGMRSGNIFQPFPEEIDRKIVAKLARLHFAPNQTAVNNLLKEHARGKIINTVYNTAKDAVEAADNFNSQVLPTLALPENFGLVSIHRTELLEKTKDLEEFLIAINKHASPSSPIVFLDHSTTKDKIKSLGYDELLNKNGIHRIPKLAFMDFIQVVKKSDYIVTDSGGLQQDAFFLGITTLIHRSVTETNEGIGKNIELSGMSIDKLNKFLDRQNEKTSHERIIDSTSPSKTIVSYLKEEKYISA